MNGVTGTTALLRLALRRDRIALPAWVLGNALLVISTAVGFAKLFVTPQERAALAASIASNAAFRALYGPPYDLSSVGGATAWRIGTGAATVAALMSILLVTRHTRADEESGRSELVGATSIGRFAGLAAGLAVAVLANALFAVVTAAALILMGEQLAVSLALACSVAAAGWVFAAVAAVTAQLTTTSRGAVGAAGSLLALAYLIRIIGDLRVGALVWLSPIGWTEQVRSFAENRWAVLLLPLPVGATLVVLAGQLAARRDFGAGLLPARTGPARAGRRLGGPWSLAWRLQRGLLAGWLVGIVAVSALLGAIAEDARNLVESSAKLAATFRAMGGRGDIVNAYLSSMLSLFAVVAAGFAMQIVLRLRAEEASGRAEPVLAAPVDRRTWALSHLAVALAGGALLMLAAGASIGLTKGLRAGDVGGQLPGLVGASLGQVPAVWTLAAVAFAFAGLLPRWSAAAWGVLAIFVLLGEVGAALQLPEWTLQLSPFAHAPQLPLHDVGTVPLVVLVAIAATLTTVGVVAVRRRDLSG